MKSGANLTPVIELYTSEGCSSCPPAERWVSTLKGLEGKAVVQAFHVGYWDYIGWVDRFASPVFTTRQRQIANVNGLRSIYTPQLVRNGRDYQDYARALSGSEPAMANLTLTRLNSGPEGDQFEATVTPLSGAPTNWTAYWTVTEHGHSSKVNAGENRGELLKHDYVVRQYTQAGDYKGPSKLTFRSIAADPKHPRQINLVVLEPKTLKPLQALSLSC
ncbi:MAG: DUF1223 domain-containing protein [Burkholderiales bacterium]